MRAAYVPERTENCGRQRSPTDSTNGLRSGLGQVDPLRETTFYAVGRTLGRPYESLVPERTKPVSQPWTILSIKLENVGLKG
jgi:hypothetical protein